jgi:CRISPR-associated protein Cas2
MVVLILENVSPSLRGELTRWLIEPRAGVFVGQISGMVRDRLWEKCCERLGDGGAVQLWSTNNEQRFAVRTAGVTRREVVDFEGLLLVRRPLSEDEGNLKG